jgi:hypothetical protein
MGLESADDYLGLILDMGEIAGMLPIPPVQELSWLIEHAEDIADAIGLDLD